MVRIVSGLIILFIGCTGIVISFFFRKAGDLALVSFGALCVVYGMRLLSLSSTMQLLFDASPVFWRQFEAFCTYIVNIPAFFFFEQILGRGWKSSIRRLWQIWLVYAVAAILIDATLGIPRAATAPNNALVILGILIVLAHLFRPRMEVNRELRVLRVGFGVLALFVLGHNLGLINQSAESIGILVFGCCLGDIVIHRVLSTGRRLNAIEQELETARRIQSSILPQRLPRVDGLDVVARYVPMADVAGDFYDFLVVDDKRLGILVADVSGHGIPAALIASMVKVAFSAQAPRAANPAQVLSGMNAIFCGKLKSQFVTAGYIYVDIARRKLTCSNAGHPPLLVWRHSEGKVQEIKPGGMFMGYLPEAEYANAEVTVEPGDRVILYTDGVVEAANQADEFFGTSRFVEFVESYQELSADQFAESLLEYLSAWTGRKPGRDGFEDDLTLVVMNVGN